MLTHASAGTWRIMADGIREGRAHMAWDERLAQEAHPAVRVFRWHPALSLGWKQAPPAWLNAQLLARAGVEVVERPTGGGIAFHGTDVSLAVVVPRARAPKLGPVLEAVCRSAVALCASFGVRAQARLASERTGQRLTYCLLEQNPYAVVVEGRKVAGFALRRYPEAWLVQGSLLVRPVAEAVMRALPVQARLLLLGRASALADAAGSAITPEAAAARWARQWAAWWTL